jgi:glycosyltransferase involved in cell wall biosynthesis
MYGALRASIETFDLVHIHSLFLFPQFAAFRQASRRRVPYVVSPRGALDPNLRRRGALRKSVTNALWQGSMLRNAAALHLTSHEEARQIAHLAPDVPRAIVPNGIDFRSYAQLPGASAFRENYLRDAHGPVVMYLGRLSHKKGLDVLIRAFALVSARHPDAVLAIVGPDDEGLTRSLMGLAEAEGVRERVVFTGMLTGEQKLAALAACDVWALPSRGENFANAALEAMAAGRGVVLSPEVNIAPDVEAAHAGIVAEATPAAFAAAIVSLLDDGPRRRALGDAAREFARGFDWEVVAPKMKALYEQVLRRN